MPSRGNKSVAPYSKTPLLPLSVITVTTDPGAGGGFPPLFVSLSIIAIAYIYKGGSFGVQSPVIVCHTMSHTTYYMS